MIILKRDFSLCWRPILASVGLLSMAACSDGDSVVDVTVTDFGKTPKGEDVSEFTLSNDQGMTVRILNYGGIIRSIEVPDEQGNIDDVVLGYESFDEYVNDTKYFGAIIGRYGNRIAGGHFQLNGETYELEKNNNGNHLHSGSTGFHKQVWQAEPYNTQETAGVRLRLVSPDGEGGYPGTLTTTAVYELNQENELRLTLEAKTDMPTPVSLTNHAYFNLAGSGSIADHRLQIRADHFTPVGEGLIPTGEIRSVSETPFDFTKPKAIGESIGENNRQLTFGHGYDHNWVLSEESPNDLQVAAVLSDPASGRRMTLVTDSPGLQFYSGNFLDGSTRGKNGLAYEHRTALCLEPQYFPDSPNNPNFPDTILRPGDTYKQQIIYRFSAR
ncbi:aldose 1-epimerase [Marinimicrobium koreense]|uniref:Aldose 1-epimerase n=1 Tax=Marinimicrobium koreense TaxID=306545 RepID=A0A3N1P2H2_9GAMM|nr:aldose epimerase family protein [Marinimicrobium koreense]ROQ21721.1 aldose 1-epimerase [Marinimicrobium koreense]